MTKLMDELVEIGAKALYADDPAIDDGVTLKFEDSGVADHERHDSKIVLNAVLPVLAQRMQAPNETRDDVGRDAVSSCWSLEPGEGFDEEPAPAAYKAMLQAFFRMELDIGNSAPDPMAHLERDD